MRRKYLKKTWHQKRHSSHTYAPNEMLVFPPGGPWTRVEERPVIKFPAFWFDPVANRFDETLLSSTGSEAPNWIDERELLFTRRGPESVGMLFEPNAMDDWFPVRFGLWWAELLCGLLGSRPGQYSTRIEKQQATWTERKGCRANSFAVGPCVLNCL